MLLELAAGFECFFQILCSIKCLIEKSGFATFCPSIEYLSEQNWLTQRRVNFRAALDAGFQSTERMDSYSTHQLSNPLVEIHGNPLEILGVLPPQQLTHLGAWRLGGSPQGTLAQHLVPLRPTRAPLGQRLPTPTSSKIPVSGTQTVGRSSAHRIHNFGQCRYGQRIPHDSLPETSPMVQLAGLAFKTCDRIGCIMMHTIHVSRPSYIRVCVCVFCQMGRR